MCKWRTTVYRLNGNFIVEADQYITERQPTSAEGMVIVILDNSGTVAFSPHHFYKVEVEPVEVESNDD